MWRFVFAIYLFHNSLVEAQQNPTISFITKERFVNIGDTVDLHCSVLYVVDYPILWVKVHSGNKTSDLISLGSTQVIPNQRYSIRHDEASSTYTLQITKIQEVDMGLYQCQVKMGSSSKLTADAWIHVRIPPIILDNSTQSIATTAGAKVSLECYATGNPTPKISWRRENNDLLPTGGTVYRGNVLIIHNITKHDRGTYYCIADNEVGKGARRHVGVKVEFAPVVTIDRQKFGQKLGYDMDLRCSIEAYPAPAVIWLKDHYQLNNNRDYKISNFSSGDGIMETTLRVIDIEARDYGIYICKAINKLGSHQHEIELYKTNYVVCPPACDIGLSGVGMLAYKPIMLIVSFVIWKFVMAL